METLLTLTVIVQPDRRRFARFAIEAVQVLRGNAFTASVVLDALLERWRDIDTSATGPFAVVLGVENQRLYALWQDQRHLLTALDEPPAAAVLAKLAEQLKQSSESADTELLKCKNRQITADLDRAKSRAAEELAQLEQALEKKKGELQESIRLAETDSLTGLLNRGAYDDRLRQALLRCHRQNEPLCLVLLDLDKFKEINDTHGHQYGDEYLKRMAQSIRAAVREHVDHPCRMGGDEFAIVLFAELDIAKRVAQRVLDSMEQRVSIGVARARADDDVTSLVARTDAALYEAKHRGRGQYVAADDPPLAATRAGR